MTNSINPLIQEWQEANRELKRAKQLENEIRMKLAKAVWGDSLVWDGTKTHTTKDGIEVKGKIGYQYKVCVDDETLDAMLNKLPDHIADELIRWKPEVSVTVYKKLNRVHLKLVEDIIEIKPGLIQISVV